MSIMKPCVGAILLGIILNFSCFLGTESDEIYREMFTNEPCGADIFRCNNERCTRLIHRCDGDNDCGDYSDEQHCHKRLLDLPYGYHRIRKVREDAVKRLIQMAENQSIYDDWNYAIARTAMAVYFTNETYFATGNATGDMLAHKLRVQMLEILAQRSVEDIPTSQLAVFVNALLVACMNPRSFHGVDLVVELRARTAPPLPQYVNPYALLALCNAGERMTPVDVYKLKFFLDNEKRKPWTDMQAYSIMALSCAAAYYSMNMTEKAQNLKNRLPKQDGNGIADNIKTTALLAQAFIAAGMFPPRPRYSTMRYFNSYKALDELIRILENKNTIEDILPQYYYISPVLSYKSLANISFSHCMQYKSEPEIALEEKVHVAYSLWFGIEKYMEKTIRLRAPIGAKFQWTMNKAVEIDQAFRYNTTLRYNKPYIYTVSGTEDDPESDKFWLFYRTTNNVDGQFITQDPFQYVPSNNEHLVLWFRTAPWAMEEE